MNQGWFYHTIYTLCVIKSKNAIDRSIVNGNLDVFALILSVISYDRMRKKTSLPGGNFFLSENFHQGGNQETESFFIFGCVFRISHFELHH